MLSEAFQMVKTAKRLSKTSAQTQIELTANSVGESEIVRVLSVNGAAEVDLCEVSSDFSAAGKASAFVVVLRADGSIDSEKVTTAFNIRASGTASAVHAKAHVIDIKVQAVAADNVRLTMIVGVDFHPTVETEANILTGGGEDIFVKTSEMKTFKLLSSSTEELSEDVNLECKFPLQKILSVSTSASMLSISCDQDIATLEGQIFAEVFALTDEETPRLITISKNQSFKTQIAVSGLCADCNISGVLSVKTSQIESEIGGKDIVLICPMTFAFAVLNPTTNEIVSDLFSTQHVLDAKREDANFSIMLRRETFSGKIEGHISISEDQPRVDKFLATSGSSVSVLSATLDDDLLEVVGIAKTSVIYLNDEENITNSVETEIPFTIRQRIDSEEGASLHADALLSDVDITIKRGREVYFDAKLVITATLWRDESASHICEVSAVSDVPKNDAQIEIFFTGAGQTFWDIAKKTHTNEDVLRQQNQNIFEPFSGSERLVVYHQKMAR